jgi:hypothetical protein
MYEDTGQDRYDQTSAALADVRAQISAICNEYATMSEDEKQAFQVGLDLSELLDRELEIVTNA